MEMVDSNISVIMSVRKSVELLCRQIIGADGGATSSWKLVAVPAWAWVRPGIFKLPNVNKEKSSPSGLGLVLLVRPSRIQETSCEV